MLNFFHVIPDVSKYNTRIGMCAEYRRIVSEGRSKNAVAWDYSVVYITTLPWGTPALMLHFPKAEVFC